MDELKLIRSLAKELWPLNRSITGPGIEQSYEIFSRYMNLSIEKITTGTKVFDWTVPQEWHLKSAKLLDPSGKTVCDSDENNLHVVNYSQPVDTELSLEELQHHLHSIPELPEAIPYVTSYYQENWGFCLTHKQREQLQPGTYKAVIDADLVEGGVPIAQTVIPGQSKKEVLLSSYLCHPSMANNELSGPLTLLLLYLRIANWPNRRYTYRFLLNPETIGALCFLSKYHQHLNEYLLSGLVLTCLGGPDDGLRYKQSFSGDTLFDKVFNAANKNELHSNEQVSVSEFTPIFGSDERQYAAPGFRLPVAQISRTTYGNYKGYHNSLDTLEFMTFRALINSADTIENLLKYAEYCDNPINLSPFGEPQLGKRELYPNLNSRYHTGRSSDELADSRVRLSRILTILSYADGNNDLFEIAKKCQCSIDELIPIIDLLEEQELIAYGVQ